MSRGAIGLPPERWLAAIAAGVSIVVCGWVLALIYLDGWAAGPLPGLYVLEMLLLGLSAAGAIARPVQQAMRARWPWLAAGAMAGFAIMGLWSIGPAFGPLTILLLAGALLADRRQGRTSLPGAGLFLVAAVAQATAMLVVVQLA